MTGPRDWDKELADIDKLMGSCGGAPPPPPSPSQNLPAQRQAAPSAPQPAARPAQAAPSASVATRKRDTLIVWLKASFASLGAAALMIWPYDKTCGGMLYVYLIGVLAVFGAGIWTMMASWSHRRGLAHMVGMIILIAALALAAIEILPRIGMVTPARLWICST